MASSLTEFQSNQVLILLFLFLRIYLGFKNSFCFVTRLICHIDVTYISTQYRRILFYNDQYSEEISRFVSIKPKNAFFNNCLCLLQFIIFFLLCVLFFLRCFVRMVAHMMEIDHQDIKLKLIKQLRLTCSNITQNTI